MDEYLYLWAQWGILNFEQYKIVKKEFSDLENAWKKITPDFLQYLGFGQEKITRILKIRERMDFQYLTNLLQHFNVQILCIDDDNYPASLKTISNPPVFLFIRGKLPALHKAIAVVGTRKITDYGKMATEKLVTDLVHNNFTIVSGLALGVDGCAHHTTLGDQGVTIAVLGSGVDVIYPVAHRNLANQIVANNGAVISEYPLSTPASAHHFPLRNRIVSGLSRGTLVIEGGVKSGALITARYALEQGRDVFAVPNNITKRILSGTNHLIRRGEAKLVEKIEDILEEYQMQPTEQLQPQLFEPREKELLELLAADGKSIDELALETPYNVARLSEILINLQLKGVAKEVGRKWIII